MNTAEIKFDLHKIIDGLSTSLEEPVKQTTPRRFKLTRVGRFKLTTAGRTKLTT